MWPFNEEFTGAENILPSLKTRHIFDCLVNLLIIHYKIANNIFSSDLLRGHDVASNEKFTGADNILPSNFSQAFPDLGILKASVHTFL